MTEAEVARIRDDAMALGMHLEGAPTAVTTTTAKADAAKKKADASRQRKAAAAERKAATAKKKSDAGAKKKTGAAAKKKAAAPAKKMTDAATKKKTDAAAKKKGDDATNTPVDAGQNTDGVEAAPSVGAAEDRGTRVTLKLLFGSDDEDSSAEEQLSGDAEGGASSGGTGGAPVSSPQELQVVPFNPSAAVVHCLRTAVDAVCSAADPAETTCPGGRSGVDGASGDEGSGGGEADTSAVPSTAYCCLDSDGDEEGTDSELFEFSGELATEIDSVSDMESDLDEEACNYDDELYQLSQDKAAVHDMKQNGWNCDAVSDPATAPEYPGLYAGQSGPSAAALAKADSPIDLFFFFMSRRLWRSVAVESNRYFAQSVPKRASALQDKQKRLRRNDPEQPVERKKTIRHRLRTAEPVKPRELVVVLGLMLARMMCPHKRRLAYHWANTSIGAIPKGTFGPFMPRNRFDEILATLHFSDNLDPKAKGDRAWKIRPVVSCLQRTFKRGYICPGVLSFDEGMLPSRSPYNGTRVFMKDKPHRWGTKLFLTCAADTAYCLRLEVYCGVKQHLGQGAQTIDAKSGPSAVLRNMQLVIPKERTEHHVVAIDRYYSSVPLALELLARKIYVVGTVQTTRIGFAAGVTDKRKKRPKDVARGEFKLATNKQVPTMVALSWMDSKPVHFLSTGASTKLLSVGRRLSATERVEVPAPKLVKDYHRWMGGVDVHDQLRLQRYSLQLAFVFKKYYKSLFLGLVDMALVNAYIVHKTRKQQRGEVPMSRDDFLETLQNQLLLVTDEDMEIGDGDAAPPTPTRSTPRVAQTDADGEHAPAKCPDFRVTADGSRRRYQQACKVCSRWDSGVTLLTSAGKPKRGMNTKWFCPACASDDGRCYLCNIVRPRGPHPTKTCFQVWHEDWGRGRNIPLQHKQRAVQYRAAPGKRKRKRRADNEDDEEGENDE